MPRASRRPAARRRRGWEPPDPALERHLYRRGRYTVAARAVLLRVPRTTYTDWLRRIGEPVRPQAQRARLTRGPRGRFQPAPAVLAAPPGAPVDDLPLDLCPCGQHPKVITAASCIWCLEARGGLRAPAPRAHNPLAAAYTSELAARV